MKASLPIFSGGGRQGLKGEKGQMLVLPQHFNHQSKTIHPFCPPYNSIACYHPKCTKIDSSSLSNNTSHPSLPITIPGYASISYHLLNSLTQAFITVWKQTGNILVKLSRNLGSILTPDPIFTLTKSCFNCQ